MTFVSKLSDRQRVEIDNNNWAITLIRVNKVHAQIVVEKVKENKYKMKIVHLMGSQKCSNLSGYEIKAFKKYGKVDIFDMEPHKLRWKGKTKTWLVEKIKVQAMMSEARKDAENRLRTPFNIAGGRSVVFYDMRMQIQTDDETLLKLLTHDLNKYDQVAKTLLEAMPELAKQEELMLQHRIEDIEKKFERVINGLPEFRLENDSDEYSKAYESVRKLLKGKNNTYYNIQRICLSLSALYYNKNKVKYIKAQNCFTWACEKLEILGIDLLKDKENLFYTNTKSFTG